MDYEKLTDREIDIMRHSLGRDYPWKKPKDFRNYFAAEPESEDYRLIEQLVGLGLMQRGHTAPGGLVYFHVSTAGIAALKAIGEENKR